MSVVWVVIGLVGILIILSYKYFELRYDIFKITGQLRSINKNILTNQNISTQTHHPSIIRLNKEMNTLLDEVKSERIRFNKSAQALNQEITNVSHDLRTPLTSVKGYIDALRMTDDPADVQRYLDIIDQKSDVLINMVELFHDVHRIGTQDYNYNVERLVIDQFVKEVFLSYYTAFEDKGIQLMFSNQGTSEVLADPNLMNRVLNNLIQNVLRYGERIARVMLEDEADYVVLEIQNETLDDIEDGDQSVVFHRFYTHESSRTYNHSGLGLYIVKKIVERQGGYVTAHVKSGTFIIRVYLKRYNGNVDD